MAAIQKAYMAQRQKANADSEKALAKADQDYLASLKKLVVEDRNGATTALLMSDDPPEAINDDYTGNSYYIDDIRRAKELSAKQIHYVDVGTSGGVWGLERGYCMMIGGEPDVVKHLDPIFATLAPGVGDTTPFARHDARHRGDERRLAGGELVEHDAEREDVGARVERFAARLLGRHVRRRAEDHAHARHRR